MGFANTLPGRLELPTLRLTASRSNQLSYGSRCEHPAACSCNAFLHPQHTHDHRRLFCKVSFRSSSTEAFMGPPFQYEATPNACNTSSDHLIGIECFTMGSRHAEFGKVVARCMKPLLHVRQHVNSLKFVGAASIGIKCVFRSSTDSYNVHSVHIRFADVVRDCRRYVP